MKTLYTLATLAVLGLCSVPAPAQNARAGTVGAIVQSRLPALGHRNWIVVADSAYPLQIAPGIETVTVTESQLSAVKQVLARLAATKHVRPIIYLDQELKFVPEKRAPGVTAYRNALNGLLAGKSVTRLPHEEIIAKLDKAGGTFKVLLIKTPHIQPYTSVFFELDCGYWTAASEKELREAMKKGG